MLEVMTLGSLRIAWNGEEIDDLEPRQKKLLGILVTRREREPLSVDVDLTDMFWDGNPPSSHRTSIYNIKNGIQSKLALRHAKSPIKTIGKKNGYQFDSKDVRFDETQFIEMVDFARDARERGELEVAWEAYPKSISLWQGRELRNQPMRDVDLPKAIRDDLAYLVDLRLDARQEWCDTGLLLGLPGRVVPFLRDLSLERALSESVHKKLMLAEYRNGDADAACDVFERFRGRKLRQKNREPSAGINRLHQQILDDDPALNTPGTSA